MSSDNHMTDICAMVVRTKNEHPRMFTDPDMPDMEAKLWATCFRTANPHMFLDPWDLYRRLPEAVIDWIAMWSDAKVEIKPREDMPTANPQPEDQFALILQGRDQAPVGLFRDPAMEAGLFAYCLNSLRPHGGHGRTMHHAMPQILQEFVEAWKFVECL